MKDDEINKLTYAFNILLDIYNESDELEEEILRPLMTYIINAAKSLKIPCRKNIDGTIKEFILPYTDIINFTKDNYSKDTKYDMGL